MQSILKKIRALPFFPARQNSGSGFFYDNAYKQSVLIGCGVGLLAFALAKGVLFSNFVTQYSAHVTTVLALGFAFAGVWLRASELTPAAKVIYRTTVILFALYLIASHVPLPPTPSKHSTGWFLYGPWIGLAAAVISFWRPSFAIVTYACVLIQKRLTSLIWGIPLSQTDYMPVIESSTLLILAAMGIVWYRNIAARRLSVDSKSIDAGRFPLVDAAVLFAIGLHFSNYLWSGIAKLQLTGAKYWTWVIENPTHELVEWAADAGIFTIGHGLSFSEEFRQMLPAVVPLINVVTLVTQLACILVFWRRWQMILVTLIYDLQHIVIFLLTGIFFWKWILLNTALVLAMKKLQFDRIPRGVGMLACAACILAGFAGNLFFVAKLGWFDTPSYNRLYASAVTSDGKEIVVPSNYFGPLSLTVAQMRVPTDLPRAFPTGTGGSTGRYQILKDGLRCELKIDDTPGPENLGRLMERFTRDWHSVVLKKIDASGRLVYDWYPHHIWSDPRRYDDFRELDKRKIVAYRWRRDAVCLDMSSLPAKSSVMRRFEKEIRVDSR